MQMLFPEQANLPLILSLFPILYTIPWKTGRKGKGETEAAMKESAVNVYLTLLSTVKRIFFKEENKAQILCTEQG